MHGLEWDWKANFTVVLAATQHQPKAFTAWCNQGSRQPRGAHYALMAYATKTKVKLLRIEGRRQVITA
jgi:hypothetical protein